MLYGNTLSDIIIAGAVFLVIVGAGIALRALLTGRITRMAQETDTKMDDMLLLVIRSFGPRFYILLGLLVSLRPPNTPNTCLLYTSPSPRD